LIDKVKVL